jgi:hypothetical protein
MHMIGVLSALFAPFLFAIGAMPQADVTPESGEIELRVELRQGGHWQPVDVHTVFHNRDEIRFTFRSSFGGYLKVVNRSSDGMTASLFPFSDSKQMGQVEANTDYVIPATKGSFLVGGKPGFDLTEWLVSSVPLEGNWQPTVALPKEPNTMLPKCPHDDLQAHRSCLDNRAGPAAAPVPATQDSNASADGPLVSRDLNFRSRDLSAVISVPDTSRKLVVYEFRVAHR